MKQKNLYLIHYRDPLESKNVRLKVGKISDSPLGLSFVMISDFVFETSGALVQPVEEQMKKRFEGTKSLHLSIYSIISIEELSSSPLSFKKDKSKILLMHSENNSPKH